MAEDQEGAWRLFEKIKGRGVAYKVALSQEKPEPTTATQDMLIDLAKFCHANETCVMLDQQGRVDDRMTYMREGRREVWLRLMENYNMTSQQLFTLYTGKQFNL